MTSADSGRCVVCGKRPSDDVPVEYRLQHVCSDACSDAYRTKFLREKLEAMRESPTVPDDFPFPHLDQWVLLPLLERFPTLRKFFLDRWRECGPVAHVMEILDAPVGQALPPNAHRWLQDSLRAWLQGGFKPVDLPTCMGLAAGVGELSPVEKFFRRDRDQTLIRWMIRLTALGATAIQAATLACARYELRVTPAFQQRPIEVESLLKKFYAFPTDDLEEVYRLLGMQLTPEDIREFLKQFPLDQVPELRQRWRELGVV